VEKAGLEELIAAEEVGERIAESIQAYFKDPASQELVQKLNNAGVKLQIEEHQQEGSGRLEGLTFVISGSFQQHNRDELKELIEQHGGKNASSVSSKTSYLLGGDGMGPAKMKKVMELGVPVITEIEFLQMIS